FLFFSGISASGAPLHPRRLFLSSRFLRIRAGLALALPPVRLPLFTATLLFSFHPRLSNVLSPRSNRRPLCKVLPARFLRFGAALTAQILWPKLHAGLRV